MKTRFCRDCKSCNKGLGFPNWQCTHHKTTIKKTDVVSGETYKIQPLCSFCRDKEGKCGKRGKYWEGV